MKSYLHAAVGLIVFYALLSFVEDVRIAGQRIFEFPLFFYVLTAGIPLTVLLIPWFRRVVHLPLMIAIVAILYAALSLVYRPRLDFSDKGILLSMAAEVLCLLVAVFLTVNLARHHQALEKLMQSLLLPPTQHKILSMAEDISLIEDEFYRARRFDYPVSALFLNINPTPARWENEKSFTLLLKELQDWIKQRYLLHQVIKAIDGYIRKSDLVVCSREKERLLLVFPDTSVENLMLFASRLQNRLEKTLKIKVDYGAASFPEDAATFLGLVTKAQESLAKSSQTWINRQPDNRTA